MNPINHILEILFNAVRSEEVLGLALGKSKKEEGPMYMDTSLRESMYMNYARILQNKETIDQLSIDYQVLASQWMSADKDNVCLQFSSTDTVFNVLLHAVQHILKVKDGDPLCRFTQLLNWQELSVLTGEDMLVTAYLAAHDLRINYERDMFDWEVFIPHDAQDINALLQKPLVDLHQHLKGSSVNFEVNWLSLMNLISSREQSFNNFSQYQRPEFLPMPGLIQESLHLKVIKACAIRLFLFKYLRNALSNADFDKLIILLKEDDESVAISSLEDLQGDINATREEFGISFKDKDSNQSDKVDYALVDQNFYLAGVFGGERRLLYSMFKRIYSNQIGAPYYATFFYAYLLTKNRLRLELVQENDTVGFTNFAKYQDRKTAFIQKGTVYERLIPMLAVRTFITPRYRNRAIETRIGPENTKEDYLNTILKYDNWICSSQFERNRIGTSLEELPFSYVVHFIKQRDDTSEKDYGHLCRSFELRNIIQRQAESLYAFRNQGSSYAGRIVGIDAANYELQSRPEVMAQAFRYLRDNPLTAPIEYRPSCLGMTYHVGEDFWDIVDGLRAIEEVMLFLNFSNGDRLGHALVLGTNVRTYYANRNYCVRATKQVLLDNIVWLYKQIVSSEGTIPLCSYLKSLYHSLYNEIYNKDCKVKNVPDIIVYYHSWLLRGDNPDYYKNNSSKDSSVGWHLFDKCVHPEVNKAREDEDARKIYKRYHYSESVKIVGSEGMNLVINRQYRESFLQVLENIQQRILKTIERKRICIECNPTSNYKIGEFTRYDQHPIFQFFNEGIETPYPKQGIYVSINTDDRGIFSTSLEREYSLIALALEKNEWMGERNTKRSVVNWLNEIRKMSLEQRFDTRMSLDERGPLINEKIEPKINRI